MPRPMPDAAPVTSAVSPSNSVMLIYAALNCRRAAAAHDELQIAQIDEYAERLPDNEHRVFAVQRVAEQHQPAANREYPERGRHHAAAGAFGGDPLHDKAHREQNLRDIADEDAPIHVSDEHIVQIAPES